MFATSHSGRAPWFKMLIAGIVIVAMLFTFTPRRSDALLLALLAPATIGAAIAIAVTEIIIYCAIGLICGGGGGGGSTSGPGTPGGSCDPQMGSACRNANACSQQAPTGGTIQCDGSCSGPPMPNYTYNDCSSAANYCGMTNVGDTYCDGSCTATVPNNSLCTGQPFPPVVPGTPGTEGFIINPPVVRTGGSITIQWDLGQNYPPDCTLTGVGVGPGNTYTFSATEKTGARVITNVTSAYDYTLTCGASTVSRTVFLIPVVTET